MEKKRHEYRSKHHTINNLSEVKIKFIITRYYPGGILKASS